MKVAQNRASCVLFGVMRPGPLDRVLIDLIRKGNKQNDIHTYGLVNPWTDFSNLSFSTDPTIPVPNQGLGTAVRTMITDELYVLGGLADANGDPSRPGDSFSSFFDDGEYFKHLEFGWTSSFDNRFNDNIHLTVWQVDEREEAQVNT